jgi:hypothetical protein
MTLEEAIDVLLLSGKMYLKARNLLNTPISHDSFGRLAKELGEACEKYDDAIMELMQKHAIKGDYSDESKGDDNG